MSSYDDASANHHGDACDTVILRVLEVAVSDEGDLFQSTASWSAMSSEESGVLNPQSRSAQTLGLEVETIK